MSFLGDVDRSFHHPWKSTTVCPFSTLFILSCLMDCFLTRRPQFYSANPAMVFSGIVACATDVRPSHAPLINHSLPLKDDTPRSRSPFRRHNSPRRPMAHRPNSGRNSSLRPRPWLRQVRNGHAFSGRYAYESGASALV